MTLKIVEETATGPVPVEQMPARFRLASLIERARCARGWTPEELAAAVGVSNELLTAVRTSMAPLPLKTLREIAERLDINQDAILQAARDFHEDLWGPAPVAGGVRLESIDMQGRTIDRVAGMPAEQVFVEYREGWTAGGSGRLNPGDMSPAWSSGYEDGRVARESALHQKQVDLELHYEGAEPSLNGGSR